VRVEEALMDSRHTTDQQQLLAQMARDGTENRRETSVVVSPGDRVTAWAVKVMSHVIYNVYMVRAVVVGDPGTFPLEIGEQMEATNLAESFLDEGTVVPGTCAVMCRVGQKNVFYAVP
jgi:hypothetical protein